MLCNTRHHFRQKIVVSQRQRREIRSRKAKGLKTKIIKYYYHKDCELELVQRRRLVDDSA